MDFPKLACSFFNLFVFTCAFYASGFCQKKSSACLALKDGSFHTYVPNTNYHIAIYRNGAVQREINTTTGDSLRWSVEWTNDCTYTLRYQSGKLKKEELAVREHLFIYQIVQSTADYYLVNGYLDKIKNLLFSDTVWIKEKASVPDRRLFSPVALNAYRKERITDTSKYALLYVYRPGKTFCSMMSHVVNANVYPICEMKNGSAYVFRILKEGPLKLWSVANKSETAVTIPIQFGKKYYLSTEAIWKTYCPLGLKLVEEETGKNGFEEAATTTAILHN